jgi:hypothetical protein
MNNSSEDELLKTYTNSLSKKKLKKALRKCISRMIETEELNLTEITEDLLEDYSDYSLGEALVTCAHSGEPLV